MDGSDLLLQLAGVGKTEIFVGSLKVLQAGSEKRLVLAHCLMSTISSLSPVVAVAAVSGGGGSGVACCVVGSWNCCS